ncbi:MAG: hypothetical protein JNM27_09920 [Leptospirales bacterium]|nr:hypothetical protein [Leptospirales bacterium]
MACRSVAGKGESRTGTIDIGGRSRTYLIYQPVSRKPVALIFVLHGGSGHADRMGRLATDLFVVADSSNVAIVLPQGVDESWNDGRLDPISTAHKARIDDVAFLNALADRIGGELSIPRSRTSIMGISNGGMMSQRAVCDSDRFQKAVSVAANFPADYVGDCKPAKPKSVLYIVGTEDPLVPFNGGPIKLFKKTRGNVLSAFDSAAYWRNKNQCTDNVTSDSLADTEKDETTATRQIWQCPGSRVGIVVVKGGGHTWPGGKQYLPEMIVGRTSRDFSAAKLAIDWMLEE